MPLRSVATAAALVLAGLAPPAAQATATGHIVQGPLTWTLIDLDPNDGIAPSLSFQPLPVGNESPGEIDILVQSGGMVADANRVGDGSGVLSSSYASPHHGAFGQMTGAAAPGALRLEAAASTSPANAADWAGLTYSQVTPPFLQFLLGPHTGVLLSVVAHADGSVSDFSVDEYSRAQLELQAGVYYGNGNASFWSDGAMAEAASLQGAASYDRDLRVDFSFGNDTASSASGYLGTDVFVWTRAATAISPVPEPAAAWMLAPGLLLLGLRGRRAFQLDRSPASSAAPAR